MGFFDKIKAGLTRTKENIGHSLDSLFAGELDDDFYDELEETLILGDMGMDTTIKAVAELRRRVKAEKIKDMDEVAYVRFASVYREFKDVNTFMEELGKLLKK